MKTPETEALGDALGFGSAFLFASVFGMDVTLSDCCHAIHLLNDNCVQSY